MLLHNYYCNINITLVFTFSFLFSIMNVNINVSSFYMICFCSWISFKYYVDLPQHYLGEADVRLPQVYQHCPLANGDLEPFIRVCLLDPSFHAFVEKVEGELRKMLQE